MSNIKTAVCPYNPAHVMPEISLIGHLSKCTFRTNEFDSCKYNAMHIMRKELLDEHQRKCQDKKESKNDDDWGISEEVRQNMRKEVEERRQQKKAQKAANKAPKPEVQKKQEPGEEVFKEPDFGDVGSNAINLTTIEESSTILNQSLKSKVGSQDKKKSKKGTQAVPFQ